MKFLISLLFFFFVAVSAKAQVILAVAGQKTTTVSGGGGGVVSTILDTLAGNVYLNSTGRVDDSTTSGWNNVLQSTAGTQTTSQPLKWKHHYDSVSTVTASFFHGSNSTSTTTCSNEMAPNNVMAQASIAAGSTTIGDPTTGGRYLTFSGVPSGTWTFIYLGTRWTGASLTMTVSAVNQSGQSGTVDIFNNCTNNVTLTGLSPVSGQITILIKGSTATANTYLSGFYLIKTANP